jgi:hypothetical protein
MTRMIRTRARSLLVVVTLFAAAGAGASPNDVDLLGLVDRSGGGTVARQGDFRLLTQELAVVMTPTSLQPAETTGQSGFDFGVDYGFHDIFDDKDYWQDALEGRRTGREPFPVLQTLGVRGRKGFPLPLPLSSEIELGATWLLDSHLVNLGGNLRLALNEGFRWIPDIAVMAGVNRLVGSEDLDLFDVSAGAAISKGFGIMGSFNLAPFVSYQSIFINAASRVLDPDPSNTGDVGNNIVFEEIRYMDNRVDRISFGARANVAIVQLTAGADVNILPNARGDRRVLMQYGVRAGLLF